MSCVLSEGDCVFTPTDFLQHLAKNRKMSVEEMRVPSNLLITYSRTFYDCAKDFVQGEQVDWWPYGEMRPLCVGKYGKAAIAVDNIWVGAPVAVMTLEELIACGARRIVEVGMCGGLQPFLQPGDIVVPTEAIRDEGTSSHYLSADVKVESSSPLRNTLIQVLNQKRIPHHVGRVWSTDGVYRETRAKFREFRDAGVLGVNMETSAIFAVTLWRGVEAASVQVVSDILTEREWLIHFLRHKKVRTNMRVLIEVALETLAKLA